MDMDYDDKSSPKIKWNEPNVTYVVSFALDLIKNVFIVGIDGDWNTPGVIVYKDDEDNPIPNDKVFPEDLVEAGIMPGITHDGADYLVNFGEEGKMRYPPPDESYLTVSEATRNKLVAKEILIFLDSKPEAQEKQMNFDAKDKLLFVDMKRYLNSKPSNESKIFARLSWLGRQKFEQPLGSEFLKYV